MSKASPSDLTLVVPMIAGTSVRVVIFSVDMSGTIVSTVNIPMTVNSIRIQTLPVMASAFIGTIV